MTSSSQGQALDQFLRQQFDVLQYIRDNMPAILKVADHLTPVEDLVDFQESVEALHAQLGLLTEASSLIMSASAAGITLLQATDAAAQRAALELGSAALRSEGFFASSTSFATLQSEVTALQPVVAQLLLDVAACATDAEMATLAARVTELESNDGFNARIDQLLQDLDNGTFFASMQAQLDALTATVTAQGDSLSTQITRIDTLTGDVDNLELGLAGAIEATNALSVRVTTTEDGIDVLASDITTLAARVTGAEGDIDSQGSAIDSLTVQVSDIDGQQDVLASAQLVLASRVTDAEAGIVAQGTALDTLSTRTTVTEDGIEILSTSVTELTASLTSVGNRLPNTSFEADTTPWVVFAEGAGWDAQLSLDQAPANPNFPPAIHGLLLSNAIAGTPTEGAAARNVDLPVGTAEHYILSGYIAAENCSARLEWRFLDAVGAQVGIGLVAATTAGPYDNMGLWPRSFTKIPVPVTAALIQVRFWAVDCTDTPKAWLVRPMLEEAVAGQVNPSPWTESVAGIQEGFASAMNILSARVTETEDGLEAVASDTTSLLSRMGTAEGALVNELITRSNQNSAMVSTVNTLAAQMVDVETNQAATAGAVDTLITEVSAIDGTVTSHSGTLTSLQAQVDAIDEGTGGAGAAISALDVRVTANEDALDVHSSQITALESSVTTANQITAQDEPPSTVGRTTGDLWIDTNDGNKIYSLVGGSGGSWIARPDLNKNTIFVQSTQPVANAVNDLWIDTTGGANIPKRWNGTTWVDVTDLRITANATAITTLAARTTTAEGSIVSQGTAITDLQATVNNPSTGVAVTASALSTLTARVTSAEGVNTTQASSITSLNSTVAGKADVSAVTALTTRVSTVENSGYGTNLLANSLFASNLSGWSWTGVAAALSVVRDMHGFGYQPAGMHSLVLAPDNSVGAINNAYLYAFQELPCEPGVRFCMSAYLAAHRGNGFAYVYFLDSAGTNLGGGITADTALPAAGANLATDYTRLFTFATAPAGARKVVAAAGWRKSLNDPAGANPYLWIVRPMLEIARATQTLPSPWNVGGLEMFASFSLKLDVNGYVSGWNFSNDGTTGDFTINADNFNIIKPGGGNSLSWASATATLCAHNASTSQDLILGPSFGSDTDKLILYYGNAVAPGSATMANAKVGISAGGKMKVGGTWSNYTAGWDSGAAITSTYNSGDPALVTINVAAGVFRTSGQVINYSASSAQIYQARDWDETYYLYYTDAAQLGGARTLNISMDSRVNYNNPDNVYIGSVTVSVSAFGSGSGGDGDTRCVACTAWVMRMGSAGEPQVVQAGTIVVGDFLWLESGRWGRVTRSERKLVPCVHVQLSELAASLTCSMDAPLRLADGEQVLAMNALHAHVRVRYPVPQLVDQVVAVDSIGNAWVQGITCEDDFFWAGDDPRHMLSHHNLKFT